MSNENSGWVIQTSNGTGRTWVTSYLAEVWGVQCIATHTTDSETGKTVSLIYRPYVPEPLVEREPYTGPGVEFQTIHRKGYGFTIQHKPKADAP